MKSSSIYFHKNTIMVFSSAHLASLARCFLVFFYNFCNICPLITLLIYTIIINLYYVDNLFNKNSNLQKIYLIIPLRNLIYDYLDKEG